MIRKAKKRTSNICALRASSSRFPLLNTLIAYSLPYLLSFPSASTSRSLSLKLSPWPSKLISNSIPSSLAADTDTVGARYSTSRTRYTTA